MGKYGESLGIWHLDVNKGVFDLHPKQGDNYQLGTSLANIAKRQDPNFAQKEMSKFICGLIARDYPPQSQEEQNELEMYVEFNIEDLTTELLIAFRRAKKDEKSQSSAENKGDPAKN